VNRTRSGDVFDSFSFVLVFLFSFLVDSGQKRKLDFHQGKLPRSR